MLKIITNNWWLTDNVLLFFLCISAINSYRFSKRLNVDRDVNGRESKWWTRSRNNTGAYSKSQITQFCLFGGSHAGSERAIHLLNWSIGLSSVYRDTTIGSLRGIRASDQLVTSSHVPRIFSRRALELPSGLKRDRSFTTADKFRL